MPDFAAGLQGYTLWMKSPRRENVSRGKREGLRDVLMLDINIPFGRFGKLALDGQLPYVFDADTWGYQFEGGPVFYLGRHVELGGSFVYASLPGDKGTAVGTPPWSGTGGQAYLRFRF